MHHDKEHDEALMMHCTGQADILEPHHGMGGSLSELPIKNLPLKHLPKEDPVHHPSHYCSHPSGVEAIDITRHMCFNLGNVIKYVWRADLKGLTIQDLEKAAFYLADEIKLRKGKRIDR